MSNTFIRISCLQKYDDDNSCDDADDSYAAHENSSRCRGICDLILGCLCGRTPR